MTNILSKYDFNGKSYDSVSTELNVSDRLGAIKARWALNRHSFNVVPGLYAVGNPAAESDVLVSANYKLSFDTLRKNLVGMNVWILVLDTKGVNVWCAAGKGTFGTNELVHRINDTELYSVVNHKKLILPQLGAPGVAAFEVKLQTGFSVIWGPVRAADIKAFVGAGYSTDEAMRTVNFPAKERLKLTGVEISVSLNYFILVLSIFFLASGLNRQGYSIDIAWSNSFITVLGISLAFFGGTVLTPVLLPYIPFRSFAWKGMLIGFMLFLPILLIGNGANMIELIALSFMMMALSSFLAMNFTGASTYTSLSGVLKEMKQAIPVQISLGAIGLISWMISRFLIIKL